MKIETWPNGLGAIVRSGRLMIEVWEHGGVRRCVPDNSLCGFAGTHFARVPRGTLAEMGAAALDLWRNSPRSWSTCQ